MMGRRSSTRYVLVVVDSTFRFFNGGGERDCPLFVPDIADKNRSLSIWSLAAFCDVCNESRCMGLQERSRQGGT